MAAQALPLTNLFFSSNAALLETEGSLPVFGIGSQSAPGCTGDTASAVFVSLFLEALVGFFLTSSSGDMTATVLSNAALKKQVK